mgnify:CR=1 FL=1
MPVKEGGVEGGCRCCGRGREERAQGCEQVRGVCVDDLLHYYYYVYLSLLLCHYYYVYLCERCVSGQFRES